MIRLLKTSARMISLRHLLKFICSTNPKNLIIYIILIVLFTVEVLTYFVAVLSWNRIDCYSEKDCTRILLVADPQLIGLNNEYISFLTPLTIWDSDRYLIKTFYHAFNFAQPDVVIFLGDLLDEGSTATDDEFKSYVRRLNYIFLSEPYGNVKHIWIPGDNDIGGEYDDRITEHKLKRFEHAFAQPEVIQFKKINFYKINKLTSTIPKISNRHEFADLNNIVIGVSHVPLLLIPTAFVDKVLDKFHPHLLFTAHMHKSMIVSTHNEIRNDRLVTPLMPDNNKIYEYYLGISEIYEILVPTCSYRMGTTKIGYGFAVIDSGNLRYTVLWTPSRFPQLIIYGLIVIGGIIYLIYLCFYKCIKKNKARDMTLVKF